MPHLFIIALTTLTLVLQCVHCNAASTAPPFVKGTCADYTAFGGSLPDVSLGSDGLPFFSWDYVSAYSHLSNPASGGIPDSVVGFLASHPFALVTIDHVENILGKPAATGAESKLAATATRFRALNNNMPIVFYQNSVKDLTYFSLYCKTQSVLLQAGKTQVTLPSHSGSFPLINCHTGATVMSTNDPVYDWTNANMYQAWVDQFHLIKNFTSADGSPLFAGIFLDLAEKTAATYSLNTPTWTKLSKKVVAQWDKMHTEITALAAQNFTKGIAITNNINFNTPAYNNGGKVARQYEQFMFFDFTGLR